MSSPFILERTQGAIIKVRLVDIITHPANRSVDPVWCEKLHHSWGSSLSTIDRTNHLIWVMSVDADRVPTCTDDDPLVPIENIPGRKWFNLSGQHRVRVLIMAIRQHLEQERASKKLFTPITDQEVLDHPEAYWIAKTYSNGPKNSLTSQSLFALSTSLFSKYFILLCFSSLRSFFPLIFIDLRTLLRSHRIREETLAPCLHCYAAKPECPERNEPNQAFRALRGV